VDLGSANIKYISWALRKRGEIYKIKNDLLSAVNVHEMIHHRPLNYATQEPHGSKITRAQHHLHLKIYKCISVNQLGRCCFNLERAKMCVCVYKIEAGLFHHLALLQSN